MERYIKRDELVDSQGLTVEADAMKKEGDIKVITFYKFSVTVSEMGKYLNKFDKWMIALSIANYVISILSMFVRTS